MPPASWRTGCLVSWVAGTPEPLRGQLGTQIPVATETTYHGQSAPHNCSYGRHMGAHGMEDAECGSFRSECTVACRAVRTYAFFLLDGLKHYNSILNREEREVLACLHAVACVELHHHSTCEPWRHRREETKRASVRLEARHRLHSRPGMEQKAGWLKNT